MIKSIQIAQFNCTNLDIFAHTRSQNKSKL